MRELNAVVRKIVDPRGPCPNSEGFTLVEIMVGMVLLTLGLLGMAGLTTGIAQGNRLSNKVSTATTLVQAKLEDITKLAYASTPAADATVTENYNSIANFPLYKRVTSTQVNNPGPKMKTVTVSVYWDSDTRFISMPVVLTQ